MLELAATFVLLTIGFYIIWELAGKVTEKK